MAKGKGHVVEPVSDEGQSWQELFELLNRLDIPEDFLSERDDRPPQQREGLRSLFDEIDRSG